MIDLPWILLSNILQIITRRFCYSTTRMVCLLRRFTVSSTTSQLGLLVAHTPGSSLNTTHLILRCIGAPVSVYDCVRQYCKVVQVLKILRKLSRSWNLWHQCLARPY